MATTDCRTREITKAVCDCQKCPLAQTRHQSVPPSFVLATDLMVIGDFPSKEDELYGRPFVSREGTLLDKLLALAGFDPARVHKTHAVKCRPVKAVAKRSVKACSGWLEEEVEMVRPRAILCLGKTAEASLLTVAPVWQIPVDGPVMAFDPLVPVYFWKSIFSILNAGRKADLETINLLKEIRSGQTP